MSSDPEPLSTPPLETPAQVEAKAEAAAIRRRWITLGELLAVAAVVISGLTFWNGYSERKTSEAERQAAHAEKQAERQAKSAVELSGKAENDGSSLLVTDPNHSIQTIDVTFPAALGVATQNVVLEPRIEANWFAAKLIAMTEAGPDRIDGRLPVIINAGYWDGGEHRAEQAIYDIIYRIDGRILRGRKVTLRGIVRRGAAGNDGKARLDAAWAQLKPAAGK